VNILSSTITVNAESADHAEKDLCVLSGLGVDRLS
jgi:hypothetical protein